MGRTVAHDSEEPWWWLLTRNINLIGENRPLDLSVRSYPPH
jgi:hypothetical protein